MKYNKLKQKANRIGQDKEKEKEKIPRESIKTRGPFIHTLWNHTKMLKSRSHSRSAEALCLLPQSLNSSEFSSPRFRGLVSWSAPSTLALLLFPPSLQ